jgi:hypothetical protein
LGRITATGNRIPGSVADADHRATRVNKNHSVVAATLTAELAQLHDVHTTQIAAWKAQLLEGAAGVFGSGSAAPSPGIGADLKTLHAKIGELTLENDFLSAALGKAGLLSARR